MMEPVKAFNYSERAVTCRELSCANNNVCYTATENGTQSGHAYCQCQGQWAGLTCQSKLYVTRSSTSTTSITLRIRGMTSSPQKILPASKLHVTDFSVSFWSLNGTSAGCNILRLKTLHSRVTIKGLDKGQGYMVCIANGVTDLCRLQASNITNTSSKSNCVRASTDLSQDEPFDFLSLVIAPILLFILIAVIITILIIKRRSSFVQFILYFCCCRKCYCCRKRSIRRKQHIIRKQRNTSGNFLLPQDPDQPFDDSMSFGAHSFASNSALSGAGNRSSVISDSFRSGFTPDSDEKFPSFLDENPNPLFNQNVPASPNEIQHVFNSNTIFQTPTNHNSDFFSTNPDLNNSLDLNSLPYAPATAALPTASTTATDNYNALPYIGNHDNSIYRPDQFYSSTHQRKDPFIPGRHPNTPAQTPPYGHGHHPDTPAQTPPYGHGHHPDTLAANPNQNQNPPPFSQPNHENTDVNINSNITQYPLQPVNSFHGSQTTPTPSQPPPHPTLFHQHNPTTTTTTTPTKNPLHGSSNHSTPPSGKSRLFRRHYSTPATTDNSANQKSPPGAVRVFPQGDEWTKHLQTMYNYDDTPNPRPSTFDSNQTTFYNSLDARNLNLRRKKRPIIRRRPLSYDFDYHKRYQLDSEYFSDNARNFLENPDVPNASSMSTRINPTSHSTYAFVTLPRRHNSQPHHNHNHHHHNHHHHHTDDSPAHRNHFTRSNSISDTFYSPYEISTLPHLFPNSLLPHERLLPNGDLLRSSPNSKEDAESMASSYTESCMSKDSNNSNEQPSRKKRVKNLIGQFERTLPPFFRQNSRRNSTTFCDEEYFRDLSSPFVVERRTRKNSNGKKKKRPLSQPAMFEFSGNASQKFNDCDLDPIFQGHPSQHVIPPLTIQDEDDSPNVINHVTTDPTSKNSNAIDDVVQDTAPKISLATPRKGSDSSYVIPAFDDDVTNLVTPFIVERASSDESVDKNDVMANLADSYCT